MNQVFEFVKFVEDYDHYKKGDIAVAAISCGPGGPSNTEIRCFHRPNDTYPTLHISRAITTYTPKEGDIFCLNQPGDCLTITRIDGDDAHITDQNTLTVRPEKLADMAKQGYWYKGRIAEEIAMPRIYGHDHSSAASHTCNYTDPGFGDKLWCTHDGCKSVKFRDSYDI